MKRRIHKFSEDDNQPVILGSQDRPKTLVQRLIHAIGELLLWVIVCFVPVMTIIYGLICIRNQHVPAWRMRKELFGKDAVDYSMLIIAIGIWGLGYACSLKTGKPVFKVLGWIIAVVVAVFGMCYMFKR
jgi:hypothetical protein